MKNFYTSQVYDEKSAGVAKIEFLDVYTMGKPIVELYDFSSIGTQEEFSRWAFMEFGYLRYKIAY